MILKFETDQQEVYFVESTSNFGVAIAKWSSIKKYIGEFYEQICVRNLKMERNDEMIDKLEIFLKEAVGNKYGISTSQLLFKRQTVRPKKGVMIDSDRTFFCSELVAKAFKVLGFIDDEQRACSSFYPSSFSSSKNELKFAPGLSMTPE